MCVVRLVDVPAGVVQDEVHTGFLHLPSAVLAYIFFARRIQPSLSLVEYATMYCSTEFHFITDSAQRLRVFNSLYNRLLSLGNPFKYHVVALYL